MTLLLAVLGAGLGLGLLGSGGFLVLWAVWELVTAPFRDDR